MGGDSEGAELCVHLVVGATGVGKSRTAGDLARAMGAPIVVADRIQCFTELATTSGRADSEVPGVLRVWPGERTVRDGDYPAAEAARALVDTVGQLSGEHHRVVLEGGSISLLRHLVGQLPDLPWCLTTRFLRIPDRASYLTALTDRVRVLLEPPTPDRSLLDELAMVWRMPEAREFAASVSGFSAALKWCAEYAVDPAGVDSFAASGELKERLVGMIARQYLEHGLLQESVFADMFPVGHSGDGSSFREAAGRARRVRVRHER